jgi:hypothetical protein
MRAREVRAAYAKGSAFAKASADMTADETAGRRRSIEDLAGGPGASDSNFAFGEVSRLRRLVSPSITDPILTDWANLCRAYGASD